MRKYIFIISPFVSQIALSQKIQNSHLKYDNDLKLYIYYLLLKKPFFVQVFNL